jgi:NADH-quinone oxidoreductase subunit M
MAVALITIIYGALLAWRQTDLKAMVAFSSISHMGFCLMGIAALNATGFTGATLQMVTHGIITGALFLLVGALYDRTHVRDVNEFGGLAARVPRLAVLMSLALLASMGLPGLAQFVSEFHALVGAYERFGLWILIASVGILIAAAYSLRAIGSMFLGALNPRWSSLTDLRGSELAAAVPLALLAIALGIYPSVLIDLTEATITRMAAPFS